MEQINSCPVCGTTKFSIYLECTDYTVSQKTFKIDQCDACDFLFTNPRPNKNEIGPYYQSSAYISHTNAKKGLFNKAYQIIRNYAIGQKIKLITGLLKRKSDIKLLDIGCGTGEFLAGCIKKGWNGVGVEPSESARVQGIENYNLSVFDEKFLKTTKDRFDVITLWHVLEHVHDLNERLDQIKALLSSKGIVIIAVPNNDSADCNEYGGSWAAWDVPRHLYHFTPKTIKELMVKHGLRHAYSAPMVFDSYYVSLLSTHYKYGKKNYLKAIKSGMLSNQSTKGNPEKYSSVIYCFKHE